VDKKPSSAAATLSLKEGQFGGRYPILIVTGQEEEEAFEGTGYWRMSVVLLILS